MEELNVKNIRERLGFTQSQLAKRIGVDTRTIQNWESHRTPIPIAKRKFLSTLASEPHQNNVHGDNNVTVNNSEMGKLIDLLTMKEESLAKAQDHITKLLDLLGK